MMDSEFLNAIVNLAVWGGLLAVVLIGAKGKSA